LREIVLTPVLVALDHQERIRDVVEEEMEVLEEEVELAKVEATLDQ
jgi:hypothetical protein